METFNQFLKKRDSELYEGLMLQDDKAEEGKSRRKKKPDEKGLATGASGVAGGPDVKSGSGAVAPAVPAS